MASRVHSSQKLKLKLTNSVTILYSLTSLGVKHKVMQISKVITTTETVLWREGAGEQECRGIPDGSTSLFDYFGKEFGRLIMESHNILHIDPIILFQRVK